MVPELFYAGGMTDGWEDVTKLLVASRSFAKKAPKSVSEIGFCDDDNDKNSVTLGCQKSEVQGDTKKREILKNPTKIEEMQEK